MDQEWVKIQMAKDKEKAVTGSKQQHPNQGHDGTDGRGASSPAKSRIPRAAGVIRNSQGHNEDAGKSHERQEESPVPQEPKHVVIDASRLRDLEQRYHVASDEQEEGVDEQADVHVEEERVSVPQRKPVLAQSRVLHKPTQIRKASHIPEPTSPPRRVPHRSEEPDEPSHPPPIKPMVSPRRKLNRILSSVKETHGLPSSHRATPELKFSKVVPRNVPAGGRRSVLGGVGKQRGDAVSKEVQPKKEKIQSLEELLKSKKPGQRRQQDGLPVIIDNVASVHGSHRAHRPVGNDYDLQDDRFMHAGGRRSKISGAKAAIIDGTKKRNNGGNQYQQQPRPQNDRDEPDQVPSRTDFRSQCRLQPPWGTVEDAQSPPPPPPQRRDPDFQRRDGIPAAGAPTGRSHSRTEFAADGSLRTPWGVERDVMLGLEESEKKVIKAMRAKAEMDARPPYGVDRDVGGNIGGGGGAVGEGFGMRRGRGVDVMRPPYGVDSDSGNVGRGKEGFGKMRGSEEDERIRLRALRELESFKHLLDEEQMRLKRGEI
ncbi:hypothetical protein HDU76_010139 [Blyttiomyces sp. JEL0837]|nr:hypothetical protein HDU76_010139 [Blyttiomyces sp. JEL0837]